MSLGVVFNWLDECVGVSALEFGDVYYNVYESVFGYDPDKKKESRACGQCDWMFL